MIGSSIVVTTKGSTEEHDIDWGDVAVVFVVLFAVGLIITYCMVKAIDRSQNEDEQ